MLRPTFPCFRMLLPVLLILLGGCKSRTAQNLPINEKYLVKDMLEDFEQLVRVIEKNHPALYDFTTKEEFDKLKKEQFEKITGSLMLIDFYQILSPLVTKIGCGHSRIQLPESVLKDSAVSFFPLKLFFNNGRGFILSNDNSMKNLNGAEILTINGKEIMLLHERLKTYISTDGNNISAKNEVLNSSQFNVLLGIMENFPKEYTISFRHSTPDSIFRIVVRSTTAQNYFAEFSKPGPPLQFETDLTKSLAIITIRSFGFYDNFNDFKKFIDESFAQIKQAKIKYIILDLRDNSGGDPNCTAYLLTYLAQKPIAYFSKTYPGYTKLADQMALAGNHFTGKLNVLINGICFSSTGHLCALIRYHQLGMFIGTETGGTYTCNDNSQTFRLIHTGILVTMARNTFTVAVEGIPRFTGILPDYKMEPAIDDRLHAIDPTKSFAIEQVSTN